MNLAIAALLVFYIAQVGLDISWHNFCGHLGIDYCAFWSAGEVAAHKGYAAVYDLNALEDIQRTAFPRAFVAAGTTATIPAPLLPVFILPFRLLAFLGPQLGYVVWTAANALVLCWYLRFFMEKTFRKPLEARLLVLMLVAFPVFLNFFYGQVNLWLTVCAGEYLRGTMSGKRFRAGMWLAGLLIKPQFLILIAVAVLMQKAFRTIAGLVAGSAILLGTSYLMLGSGGPVALLRQWLALAGGMPAIGPSVMMNWRMVGLFLISVVQPALAWTLILVAMVLTAVGGLWPWRRRIDSNSPAFAIGTLGTLAATGAFAWHSHIASAMILICPLLYVVQTMRPSVATAVRLWASLPVAAHLLVLTLAALGQASVIPEVSPALLNFGMAVIPFAFNLYFLGWSLRATWSASGPLIDARVPEQAAPAAP